MLEMVIDILGDSATAAYIAARELVARRGHAIPEYGAATVDLAIAPLLTVMVPPEEVNRPRLGTLIFHPSPLPYGRGQSSIRWTYRRHEPVTAATWFWANNQLDGGDICEQDIVRVDYTLRPREFYERDIIPAMLRTLERCLSYLEIGFKRQIKQIEKYATYDGRIQL
jgi:formyltetrahydrofolate dehydrogenase